MKKIVTILISVALLTLILCIGISHDGTYKAPTNFKISYLDGKLNGRNENFQNVKILYLSDLCYGDLFNEEKLNALTEKITTLDYDLFIFGGDVFDQNYMPVAEDVDILCNFFDKINARLGKFMVYGDFDQISDSRQILVRKIMNECSIESLSGYHKIYNQSTSSYIYFLTQPIDSLSDQLDVYTLAISHDYAGAKQLSSGADLALCGNSHSRQVNLPFNSSNYKLGYTGNTYVTSGVGLTKDKQRIFCTPEIVIITLN